MKGFYPHYYQYYNSYVPRSSNIDKSTDTSSENDKKTSRYSSFGPVHFKNPLFTDIEEPVFEIFGIELYLDDIIIIGLLFFLYKEGVQDEFLFISLILLLIG